MFGKSKKETKALGLDELLQMRRSVDREIASRQDGELESLRTKVTTVADALGITVAELFGIKVEPGERRTKKRRDAIKYRDPENPDNTWTGNGRTPKWMQEKLGQGATKEQFQVQ